MRKGKHFWSRYLPWLFYALVLVFLVLYFQRIDVEQLRDADFSYRHFVTAGVFGLLFRYWGAFIWMVLLRRLGAHRFDHVPTLILVYAKSWLGRYIPGTAPWILAKIHFAAQQGISRSKLAVSSLLEGGLQVIVIMALSVVMLALDPRMSRFGPAMEGIFIAVLLLLVVLVMPPVFNSLVSLVYRCLKGGSMPAEHLPGGGTIAVGASLYVIGALLSGLSFFFVASAVYPELGSHNLWFVMGASNLAGAISMLALFMPSGIGVREGVQWALLSLIMPPETALHVTIVTRLWSIGLDLLFIALAWLLGVRSLRRP